MNPKERDKSKPQWLKNLPGGLAPGVFIDMGISIAQLDPALLFEYLKSSPEAMEFFDDRDLLSEMREYSKEYGDRDMELLLNKRLSELPPSRNLPRPTPYDE